VSYAGPILLMALAGILLGGAWSLRKNEKFAAAIVVAVLAVASFLGGAYLIYG
jgi:predicted metalloprotease